MFAKAGLREIIESTGGVFDIIEEFSQLTPRRRLLLCDHLFIEGREVFRETIELLWPQSTCEDSVKLEKFLYSFGHRVN